MQHKRNTMSDPTKVCYILMIFLFLWTLPTFNAQVIRELYGNDDLLKDQLQGWVSSNNKIVNYDNAIFKCGLKNWVIPESDGKNYVIKKTYWDLGEHYEIYFRFEIMYFNDWDVKNLEITLDSQLINFRSISTSTSANYTTFCENLGSYVTVLSLYGTIPHRNNHLTVEIKSLEVNLSNQGSWGVSEFSFNLQQRDLPIKHVQCINTQTFENSIQDECICKEGTFQNINGECQLCAFECLQCFGPSKEECYTCKKNYKGQCLNSCPTGTLDNFDVCNDLLTSNDYRFLQPKEISLFELHNLVEIVSDIQDALNSLTADPWGAFKSLMNLVSNLSVWEAKQIDLGCPLCSSNGQCSLSLKKCICDQGYYLPDCSATNEQLENFIKTKINLLEKLNEIFTAFKNDEIIKSQLFETLGQISNSILFNDNSTLKVIKNILESNINIDDPNFMISEREVFYLSKILDNMLFYAGETDCSLETTFSTSLEETMNRYFAVTTRSLFYKMAYTDPPTIITTINFDMYAMTTTMCAMSSMTMYMSQESPVVQMKPTDPFSTLDCNGEINVLQFAFNLDVFVCKDNLTSKTSSRLLRPVQTNHFPRSLMGYNNPIKTAMAMEVRNRLTGETMDALEIMMNMNQLSTGSTESCPSECDVEGQGTCVCEMIKMLDIKAQINRIFRKSKLPKIIHIESLAAFKFWQSLLFWSILGFTIWYIFSLYFIKWRRPEYCLIKKIRKEHNIVRTKTQKALILILTSHPLLSIYFYLDSRISKTVKLTLYYKRAMVVLTYALLFPMSEEGDDLVYKILLVLLNSVVVTPIYMMHVCLLNKTPLGMNKKRQNFCQRHRRKFGFLMALITVCGCFLITFTVSAQLSVPEQIQWAVYFGVSLFQDICISPLIDLSIMITLTSIYNLRFMFQRPLLQGIVFKAINRHLFKLYNLIWLNKLRRTGPITPKYLLDSFVKGNLISPNNEQTLEISKKKTRLEYKRSLSEGSLDCESIQTLRPSFQRIISLNCLDKLDQTSRFQKFLDFERNLKNIGDINFTFDEIRKVSSTLEGKFFAQIRQQNSIKLEKKQSL